MCREGKVTSMESMEQDRAAYSEWVAEWGYMGYAPHSQWGQVLPALPPQMERKGQLGGGGGSDPNIT